MLGLKAMISLFMLVMTNGPVAYAELEPYCEVQFVLWDTIKEREIEPIEDGGYIDMCLYMDTSLSIECVNLCTDHVHFKLAQVEQFQPRILVETDDYSAPFFMGGDDGQGRLHPLSLDLEEGEYILTGNSDGVRFYLVAFTC